jgi:hypothetical protein
MPCHHALAEAPHAYIAAAGIADDRKGWLTQVFAGSSADFGPLVTSRVTFLQIQDPRLDVSN